jgi:hypothetical protein
MGLSLQNIDKTVGPSPALAMCFLAAPWQAKPRFCASWPALIGPPMAKF